jgi:hypothetical protein
MNNFEFDDSIRRKFENARFDGAEENFNRISGHLRKRRILNSTRVAAPYFFILLLGLSLGYWMGYHSSSGTNFMAEKNAKELISPSQQNINSNSFSVTSPENNEKTIHLKDNNLLAQGHSGQREHASSTYGITKSNIKQISSPASSLQHYESASFASSEQEFNATENKKEMNEHSVQTPNENSQNVLSETKQHDIVAKNIQEIPSAETISKKDSLQKLPEQHLATLNPFIQYVKIKKNEFYVHVFGGYSFGWKTNVNNDGSGFIPEVGIVYERVLPENLSLRTGLLFTMIDHIKSCSNTFTVVEMDTRYRQTVWEFKTPTLYYFRIPVILALKDNTAKNVFHAGFLMDVLMNSRNEIIKKYQNSSNQYQEVSEIDYGYALEGFHRMNFGFSLGYRRRLTRNIRVGIDIMHHITNVIKNYQYFDNRNFKNSKAPAVYAGLDYRF